MLSGSGSLCLRMFAVYSFLLCFIFYPTQKPRPCLMCKKQPSATHRFCTGCLRPFEESVVGDQETRRPRPGDHQTVRGTFSSCGSNCACWSCRMPHKLEWEWKCETWNAAQRLQQVLLVSGVPPTRYIYPLENPLITPRKTKKSFDSARWRISKCWTRNSFVCLSALN